MQAMAMKMALSLIDDRIFSENVLVCLNINAGGDQIAPQCHLDVCSRPLIPVIFKWDHKNTVRNHLDLCPSPLIPVVFKLDHKNTVRRHIRPLS